MQTKKKIKQILKRTGLFDSARAVQIRLKSAPYFRENLKLRLGGAPDKQPVPPLDLIVLVAGSPSIGWFMRSGELAIESIHEAFNKAALDSSVLKRILDFGCGCGRVLRHWKDSDAEVYGTDMNPSLVEWCSRNLPFAKVQKNAFDPPINFPNEYFDLIYALSVFTHMPENTQLAWLREFRRILKPGGYLLITTHGEFYLPQLNERERDLFRSGTVVIREDSEEEGSNWYAAYHPRQYLERVFTDGFEIVAFIEQGARGNPEQDLLLLRKEEISSPMEVGEE